jgi:hypothetical protein
MNGRLLTRLGCGRRSKQTPNAERRTPNTELPSLALRVRLSLRERQIRPQHSRYSCDSRASRIAAFIHAS